MRKFAIVLLVLAACGGESSAQPAKAKPPVRIAAPGPLTLAPDGAIVVGDRDLRRVVRIDVRNGRRRVLASGFPEAIVGLGYDDMSRLYVSAGDRVYRVEGGRKTVLAGTGARGHTGDGGAATAAALSGAGGIDVDHDEKIAIAEYDNWIRVVSPEGVIRTVAGNGGTGYAGDGGRALDALLGHPHDVIWRRDDVLIVADSHNGVLRKVDGDGRISTFASGFAAPVVVEPGPGDVVYVADAGRRAVYRLSPDGSERTLVTTGVVALGLTVDLRQNVYVSDFDRRRIIRVTPGGRVTVVARARG